MNIFSRLNKITEQMDRDGYEIRLFKFKDGTTYEMPGNRIGEMFSDAINQKSNSDAEFFKKQLEANNPDNYGLIYALEPYIIDLADIFPELRDDKDVISRE